MRAMARPSLNVLLLGLSSRQLSCRAFCLGGGPAAAATRGRLANICLRSTVTSAEGLSAATDAPACKWQFTHPRDGEEGASVSGTIRTLLVCGDGDLSYAAAISDELRELGIEMVATVLEEEDVHNEVYQYSKANTDAIAAAGHAPMFGVDATTLTTHFGDGGSGARTFDRITFNFPHWRGKANNRYNRELLNEFLRSASAVLSPNGEIHVALCDGQGGCSAASLQEWRGSWFASMYAAQHGLLLSRVFPYDADYNLSSFRGRDRPFALGKEPQLHVFVRPDGAIAAPREVQLCCRHELHIALPDDGGKSEVCNMDQVLEGDAIETIIQEACVPEGVRVEIPARQTLRLSEGNGATSRIAVFLVVYCGERYHVTRADADRWRELAELEVEKYLPLRENRRGRTVSHPFPYPALHPEIKYHTTKSEMDE